MTTFPVDVRAELQVNGAWTDVSSRLDHGPISIGRGHPDESTTVSPSTVALELTNGDGAISPDNPNSPYYPWLTQNVPCRVSIPMAANYLRLEADSNDRAFVNQTAALNVTGSIEMRIQLVLTSWEASVLAGKWDGGNAYLFTIEDDGTLLFQWNDGAARQVASTVPVPPSLLPIALRVTMNAANGTVTFYTSTSIDGTYVQLGAAQSGSGGAATSIQSVTSPLVVGWTAGNAALQLHGQVAEVRVYNGIGGMVVADAVFSGQVAGTTTWTDSAGRTWLLGGGGEISSRDYRAHAELAELPQHQPPVDPDAIDPVTGAPLPPPATTVKAAGGGLLRRLSQRNNPAHSTMYRAWTLTGASLAAYWGMEDGPASQSLASGIGGQPMYYSGSPQLASNSDFACSDPLPQCNQATFSGNVPPYSGTWAGNQVSWLMEVPAAGEFNTAEIAKFSTSGTVASVVIRYGTGGTLAPVFYAGDGTILASPGAIAFAVNGELLLVWLSLAPDGSGGVNWELATVVPGASAALAFTGNIASASVGAVTRVQLAGSGQLTTTVLGHVAVQAVAGDLSVLGGPLNAWQLEAAGKRIQRICGEEGIPFRSRGVLANTAVMGAQTSQTVTQLIQEAASADLGVWHELRQALGWGYVPRTALYDQAAAVALTYAQDQLSEWPADPTRDDQVIANDVTVTQTQGGSSARAFAAPGQPVTGGRLSTLDPGQGGVGTYDGGGASLNLGQAADLASVATWLVHDGTVDEHRLPAIEIDMANRGLSGTLAAQVAALDLGQRLTIASPPAQLGPNALSQLAAQLAEEIWGDAHVITVTGIPSSPYHVAQEGTWHADTDGSALALPATSGATTLTVTGGTRPWTTTAGDLPFDARLGGERVTVTAVAAAGSPSTRVGAFVDGAALGTSGWTAGLAAWTAITGLPSPVTRWYGGTTYTVGTSLTQMAAAGTRILLDLAPPFSPVSSSDRTSIATMLDSLVALGADMRVSLWHEPALGGLTAAQYTAMIAYYGPTVRARYPLWCVFSGSDTVEANGFYPGDGQVDGIAADCYATSTDNLDHCEAMANGHYLPLGLWEFNTAFDVGISPSPVSAATQLQGQQFLGYVLALFTRRMTFGQPNGDLCFFSGGGTGSTGTGNFLGSSQSDAAGFEATIAHWVNSGNCSIARTTAQAHSGVASLSLTSAAAGNMSARPENIATSTTYAMAVTPGQSVAASAWFRSAVSARNVHVDVTWYSAALANLSTSNGSAVADTTSGWTFASFSGTAPASAAWAVAHVQVDSAGAAAEVHYCDDVQIALLPSSTDHTAPVQFPWDWRIAPVAALQAALDATGYPEQALTVTRSVNGVSKAHLAGELLALWDTPVIAL